MTPQPQTTHDPAQGRWTATIEGEEAGALQYETSDGAVVILHTVVPATHGGRGVGGALVRAALDHARAQGVPVVPLCSFARTWIERNPEYGDLVRT